MVAGDGHRQLAAPVAGAEVEDELFDSAPRGEDEVDVLRGRGVLAQPDPQLAHEALERGDAFDPAPDPVMQLRRARERLDQRAGLSGHHAGEERHERESPASFVLPDAREAPVR
jgi:hypothetical protein